MKKLLFFTICFILQSSFAFAELSVKTNIESGEYEFPIEINIIANEKDAKIFYYTDGEGRLDNIKEFKKVILLKEDTTIDYYATNKDYEDTLIKTSKYTFKYSNEINIIGKENKVIIKNDSGKIQNIGYWKVSGNNLNIEIDPNTFLENSETFEIDYIPKENEELIIYSPDNKIKKSIIYKKEIKKIDENTLNGENLTTAENTLIGENLTTSENTLTGENLTTTEIVYSGDTITNENKNEFELSESIKGSIIDDEKETNNKSIVLYTLAFAIFSIVGYNGYLIINNKKNNNK